MKKLWLKLGIWLLDHLEEKVNIDWNKDDVNDLTWAKQRLEEKLKELKEKK